MNLKLFPHLWGLALWGLFVVLPQYFLLAQEQVTIQPTAVLRWDDLVRIDAQSPNPPAQGRAIHSPMPGPEPRELGSPSNGILGSRSSADRQGITVESLPLQSRTPAFSETMPPTLQFEAIPDNNAAIPPDTYGSVGPSHVMTMLNTQVRVQTKLGATISTVTLATFWTSITGSKFDPKVNYDAGSGRWMAVCDANPSLATSKVCFAISASSDPTGSWSFYEFDADAADTLWADYPSLGVNTTWIAITNNMFTFGGSSVGSKMWVIDKSSAVGGGPLTLTVFPTKFDLSGGVNGFTLQPCLTFGTEPTLYIVDNSGYNSGGTFLLRISRITGTGPTPVWSVQPGSVFASSGLFFVTNNFFFTQSDAPQSGLATLIETNDPRMLNAVFRNGRIWCTHSAGLPVGGPATRTSLFWYQLNPGAMPTPIVQSGVLDGGAGVHYCFPSITANSANDACICFSRSDATLFVQAAYAGRRSADVTGTMRPIQSLKAGESAYSKFFGDTRNRWGDYSNVCVDPSDDLTFWAIQEYAGTNVGGGVNDGRWGTRWGKIDPATALAVEETKLPVATSLSQNYPNPFNPSTTIRYTLATRAPVILTVFNALGQEIATLVKQEKEAGEHRVEWKAEQVTSGMYVYRLQAGSFVENRKLVLLK